MFQTRDLSFDPSAMVWLYVVLAAVQMGLVLLTAPAVAAGSISGERERQTLDLLLVTKMSPLSIVLMYLVIGFLCFGTLVLLAFYYMSYDGLYNGDIPVLATILILIPNPGVAFFSLMDAQLGTDVTFSLLRMSDQTSAIYQWMGTHIWLLHLVFDLVVIVVFVLLSAYIINPVWEKKVRKKKG